MIIFNFFYIEECFTIKLTILCEKNAEKIDVSFRRTGTLKGVSPGSPRFLRLLRSRSLSLSHVPSHRVGTRDKPKLRTSAWEASDFFVLAQARRVSQDLRLLVPI